MVRGLLKGLRVFMDLGINVAISVSEPNYDCLVVDSSQLGLYVFIERGRSVAASLYYKFGESLVPCLSYIDKFLLLASK